MFNFFCNHTFIKTFETKWAPGGFSYKQHQLTCTKCNRTKDLRNRELTRT